MDTSYRQSAAASAAKQLEQHALFKQCQHIACYFSVNDEFDTSCILETLFNKNKNCYLPVIMKENSLSFVRYHQNDMLIHNRYAIPEPFDKTKRIALEELELVIAPLVAFDLAGHRLGAGGGFYDKTFQFIKNNPVKKPLLLGLAYAAQQATSLPVDHWDIRLDGVITEKTIHIF